MISIRKYLDWQGRQVEVPEAAEDLCKFTSLILDNLNKWVLVGQDFEALRAQILEVKNLLRPDWTAEESLQAEKAIAAVLSQHRAAMQRTSVEQALEVQHIFGMLNQALIALAEGRDRSVERLSQVQESLQRTAAIEDIVALKTSLTETVRFVREESVRAREAATEQIGVLEAEVSKSREALGRARVELAGRPEGIEAITDSSRSLSEGEAVYVVAYKCDRLPAVTQRYGAAVSDELVFRLIKERVRPVAPAEANYRWTPSSLVVALRRTRELERLRSVVADLNRSPMVHRIPLGSRTAVLTVSPSHLVVEGFSNDADMLVEQVDRFTGAAA